MFWVTIQWILGNSHEEANDQRQLLDFSEPEDSLSTGLTAGGSDARRDEPFFV